MEENYLNIMEDSLRKKSALLDEIRAYNDSQKDLFRLDDPDLGRFDAYIEEKERLVTELDKLDEGFDALFGQISGELDRNREKYRDQIRRLQSLVKEITDKTVAVQAQESRSKAQVEEYFAKRRREVGESRKGSKAAMTYYQTYTGAKVPGDPILDSKQ